MHCLIISIFFLVTVQISYSQEIEVEYKDKFNNTIRIMTQEDWFDLYDLIEEKAFNSSHFDEDSIIKEGQTFQIQSISSSKKKRDRRYHLLVLWTDGVFIGIKKYILVDTYDWAGNVKLEEVMYNGMEI